MEGLVLPPRSISNGNTPIVSRYCQNHHYIPEIINSMDTGPSMLAILELQLFQISVSQNTNPSRPPTSMCSRMIGKVRSHNRGLFSNLCPPRSILNGNPPIVSRYYQIHQYIPEIINSMDTGPSMLAIIELQFFHIYFSRNTRPSRPPKSTLK